MSELAGLPGSIGRYRVVGLLGHGGMGRVVRAHDAQLQRDVAVKLVENATAEARFMFHREARAVARLKHPNVIEVYEYSGPEAELPYIVCELLAAPTLRDVLEQRGVTLAARVATALAYELAMALDHAHGHDIVHRDVKPENVFWCDNGRIVLADFGIAKALSDARFASTVQYGATSLFGSPSYMAPEQVRGGVVDARTDLHALGALLFEVTTGAPPYIADDVESVLKRVKNGEHDPVPRDIGPAALVRLIEELLAAAPDERPGSARVVADRLRAVLDTLDVRDPRAALATDEATKTAMYNPLAPAGPAKADATRLIAVPRERGPQNWLLVAGLIALLIVAGLTAWLSVKPSPAQTPVSITVVLPGAAELLVDGNSLGPVRDVQRLQLTPGRHILEARVYDSGQTRTREIYVVGGSGEAQFEL